jgi:N6-L-threonylcarbamoyladenine synthase
MREVMVKPSGDTRKSGDKADKKSQLRTDISVNDVAASFQEALVDILVRKTVRAAKSYDATEIFLSGGVSANQRLRTLMKKESDLPVRYPPLALCTDNAAMIAAVAHYRYGEALRRGTMVSDFGMDVQTMWSLSGMK